MSPNKKRTHSELDPSWTQYQ